MRFSKRILILSNPSIYSIIQPWLKNHKEIIEASIYKLKRELNDKYKPLENGFSQDYFSDELNNKLERNEIKLDFINTLINNAQNQCFYDSIRAISADNISMQIQEEEKSFFIS